MLLPLQYWLSRDSACIPQHRVVYDRRKISRFIVLGVGFLKPYLQMKQWLHSSATFINQNGPSRHRAKAVLLQQMSSWQRKASWLPVPSIPIDGKPVCEWPQWYFSRAKLTRANKSKRRLRNNLSFLPILANKGSFASLFSLLPQRSCLMARRRSDR